MPLHIVVSHYHLEGWVGCIVNLMRWLAFRRHNSHETANHRTSWPLK